MKQYIKVKEVQDSKTFTARRLRAIERAREKELRRAEYDPDGFFRPATASSAVRLSLCSHLCSMVLGSLGNESLMPYASCRT